MFRFHGGANTAVHRDDETYLFLCKDIQGFVVQPVPFIKTVGDVCPGFSPHLLEHLDQQCSCSYAIHIVIAVNHNFLSHGYGGQDSGNGILHANHLEWIIHFRLGAQVSFCRICIQAATIIKNLPDGIWVLNQGDIGFCGQGGGDLPAAVGGDLHRSLHGTV